MNQHHEYLRRALVEMEADRRRLDADIAAVKRILAGESTAGDAAMTRGGGTRDAIAELMRDGKPRTSSEIAAVIDKDKMATTAALHRMVKKGLMTKQERGVFRIPGALGDDAPSLLTPTVRESVVDEFDDVTQ